MIINRFSNIKKKIINRHPNNDHLQIFLFFCSFVCFVFDMKSYCLLKIILFFFCMFTNVVVMLLRTIAAQNWGATSFFLYSIRWLLSLLNNKWACRFGNLKFLARRQNNDDRAAVHVVRLDKQIEFMSMTVDWSWVRRSNCRLLVANYARTENSTAN